MRGEDREKFPAAGVWGAWCRKMGSRAGKAAEPGPWGLIGPQKTLGFPSINNGSRLELSAGKLQGQT